MGYDTDPESANRAKTLQDIKQYRVYIANAENDDKINSLTEKAKANNDFLGKVKGRAG